MVTNIDTKCAEIHCDVSVAESKFSIICICGISMPDFEAFRGHFSSDHLQPRIYTEPHQKLGEQHSQESRNSASGEECLNEPLLVPTGISASGYDALATANDSIVDSNCSEAFVQKTLSNKSRKAPNICTYCGRTFRRRYLLDTHLNIHTGSKPHQCELCGKQFRAVSTLTRHRRTHEQRQALQCQHCEQRFTHRSALLSHELRHTQVRRWSCPDCDKRFYTRNQMDTHARKLHAHIEARASDATSSAHLPFACELCGNSYRSASTLSTHRLKKHYRLAKYSCECCDKKFLDANRLQQHQLIHVKPEATIK